MKNLEKILYVFFLLFFVFTAPSTADIKYFKIRSNDEDLIIVDEFEFTHTGHVSIAVSSVSVTSMPVTSSLSRPDPSRMGFFLISDYAMNYIHYERISCYLDSKYITLLFTFQDLSQSSFNKTYAITDHNLYYLRFANCNPLSCVTMDVRTEFYNTHGTTKDYLSAGQTKLPSLYFKFSIIYLCSLVFWISVCFMNRPYFHWIHLVMGVLLLMKGFNLLCAAKFLHSIKVTGVPPHGWSVFLYVFHFIRTLLFYTLIAVIIDGCFLLKMRCPAKLGLIVVLPLQIFVTIASRLEREALEEDSFFWDFGLSFAGIICKMVFIILLGYAICNSETDKGGKNYGAMFTKICLFYIVLIVCSCIDLIYDIAGRDWAMVAEIASLVVYMVLFLVFRPCEENEYFAPLNLQVAGSSVELGSKV